MFTYSPLSTLCSSLFLCIYCIVCSLPSSTCAGKHYSQSRVTTTTTDQLPHTPSHHHKWWPHFSLLVTQTKIKWNAGHKCARTHTHIYIFHWYWYWYCETQINNYFSQCTQFCYSAHWVLLSAAKQHSLHDVSFLAAEKQAISKPNTLSIQVTVFWVVM